MESLWSGQYEISSSMYVKSSERLIKDQIAKFQICKFLIIFYFGFH